jgi:hypothetical protein
MIDRVDLQIKSSFDNFDQTMNRNIRRAMSDRLSRLTAELRRTSPRGVSQPESLQSGWQYRMLSETTGILQNTTPAAFNRMAGRPPGQEPPSAPGTPLAKWAEAKGLKARIVARKIAREGTDRWIDNTNVLGVDRTTGAPQPGAKLDIFVRDLGQAISSIGTTK